MKTAFFTNPLTCHLAIYLLLKANHEPHSFIFNEERITINKGQVLTGLKKIVKESGLSFQSARTALRTLSAPTIAFLTIKSTNRFSLVSICKYEDYQADLTTKSTNKQQTSNKQATTNKNDKNVKNDKNTTYCGEFVTFWQAYPKKTGKDKAWALWQKRNPPIDCCLKTLAWQIQSDQWQKNGGKFIPHPTTWLNRGGWKDEPTGLLEYPPETDLIVREYCDIRKWDFPAYRQSQFYDPAVEILKMAMGDVEKARTATRQISKALLKNITCEWGLKAVAGRFVEWQAQMENKQNAI